MSSSTEFVFGPFADCHDWSGRGGASACRMHQTVFASYERETSSQGKAKLQFSAIWRWIQKIFELIAYLLHCRPNVITGEEIIQATQSICGLLCLLTTWFWIPLFTVCCLSLGQYWRFTSILRRICFSCIFQQDPLSQIKQYAIPAARWRAALVRSRLHEEIPILRGRKYRHWIRDPLRKTSSERQAAEI